MPIFFRKQFLLLCVASQNDKVTNQEMNRFSLLLRILMICFCTLKDMIQFSFHNYQVICRDQSMLELKSNMHRIYLKIMITRKKAHWLPCCTESQLENWFTIKKHFPQVEYISCRVDQEQHMLIQFKCSPTRWDSSCICTKLKKSLTTYYDKKCYYKTYSGSSELKSGSDGFWSLINCVVRSDNFILRIFCTLRRAFVAKRDT